MAVFYKYLGAVGAIASLENQTMKLSCPAEFNDPFDVNVHDLFNTSLDNVLNQSELILRLLEEDPRLLAKVIDISPEEAEIKSCWYQKMSPEDRQSFMDAFKEHLDKNPPPELVELKNIMAPQRAEAINLFKRSAIFCATKNHDNILMWAHYAEQHRGCVFGFEADLSQDSIWAHLEPVIYTEVRPTFYGPVLAKKFKGELPNLDDTTKTIRNLIYSKSPHWAYEEELRLYDPSVIPEGEKVIYYPFFPNELKEVYLGCRIAESVKTIIISAARALNPDVKVYETLLVENSYDLSFKLIS